MVDNIIYKAIGSYDVLQLEKPEGYDSLIIGDYAFSGHKIKHLILPDCKVIIGMKAFCKCGIESIFNIEKAIVIKSEAFRVNKLTDVKITNIEYGSGVYSQNKINNLLIEEGVTILPTSILMKNNLSHICIPSSVKVIGNSAFAYNKIESLTVRGSYIIASDNSFLYNKFSEVDINGEKCQNFDSSFIITEEIAMSDKVKKL